MKVLCLHGAFGSASNFQTQLWPFLSNIQESGEVEFVFVNGEHVADPPKGFELYFGNPPLYRNIDFDGTGKLDAAMDRLREISSDGECYEDAMRELMPEDENTYTAKAVLNTIDHIFRLLKQDPEIKGILGYSEGAAAAASFLMEEQRRHEQLGQPRQIEFAVFFAGWPPVSIDGEATKLILADSSDKLIDVPTCHVVGCADPYLYGALCLYAVCDEDVAVLFDHGKGHTVPRDAVTVKELAGAIRATMGKACAAAA